MISAKLKPIISMLLRVSENISLRVVWLGVAFILIMVGGMSYEVLVRYVVGKSTGIMDEVVSLLLVGIVVTGIAYTLRQDAHVKVSILTDFLPKKMQTRLSLVTSAISLVACLMAVYYLGKEALNSYTYNMKSLSPLSTPLYIPQAVLCFGFATLAWELIREIHSTVKSLRART